MPLDTDEAAPLVAFPTRSRSADPKFQFSVRPISKSNASTLLVPFVSPISPEGAHLDQALDDLHQLVATLRAVVVKHDPLLAESVALTEERLRAEFACEMRSAMETATLAAMHATEVRASEDLSSAVARAVTETKLCCNAELEAAVAEAIASTEQWCKEQQRISAPTRSVQREFEVCSVSDQVARPRSSQLSFPVHSRAPWLSSARS